MPESWLCSLTLGGTPRVAVGAGILTQLGSHHVQLGRAVSSI
jgi:hypothetical protein